MKQVVTFKDEADLIRFLTISGANPGDAATEMAGMEVFHAGNYVKPADPHGWATERVASAIKRSATARLETLVSVIA